MAGSRAAARRAPRGALRFKLQLCLLASSPAAGCRCSSRAARQERFAGSHFSSGKEAGAVWLLAGRSAPRLGRQREITNSLLRCCAKLGGQAALRCCLRSLPKAVSEPLLRASNTGKRGRSSEPLGESATTRGEKGEPLTHKWLRKREVPALVLSAVAGPAAAPSEQGTCSFTKELAAEQSGCSAARSTKLR